MVKKISCLFLFISIFHLYPVELQYQFIPGSVLYIETNTQFTQYVDGEYLGESKVKNISYIKVLDLSKNRARQSGTTHVLEERQLFDKRSYRVKDSYTVEFKKDIFGKTTGLDFIEGFHDFPSFPDKNLKEGESWIKPVVFLVKVFGENTPPVKFDVEVFYRLLSIDKEKKVASISANMVFTQNNKGTLRDYNVYKFSGFSNFIIYFDLEMGKCNSIEETFDYTYLLEDGTLIETSGSSLSLFEIPPPIKKEEVEEIENKIDKNTKIKMTKENNLSISIEKILFKPDSAELLPEEKNRLSKIAVLLENYKFNRIMIIGHTAKVGQPDEEKTLSEERAKVVLDYLVEKHHFNSLLLSYEGKGSEEPIADNTTAEGKEKNRRVEIIILQK